MRGLPHLRTAPEALAAWDDPKNIDLLARMGVLTRTGALTFAIYC